MIIKYFKSYVIDLESSNMFQESYTFRTALSIGNIYTQHWFASVDRKQNNIKQKTAQHSSLSINK